MTAFYFVAHANADPAGTWQAREDAFGTANAYDADGHISVKTDATGNILAAVKTNRNDDPAPNGGDPLITVLKRTGSAGVPGSWASHPVTTVTVGGTRPILVIDDVANEANVFLTSPEQAADGPQAIYRRTAPLSTLNFGAASIGTAFIKSATEVAINDATSTKQRDNRRDGDPRRGDEHPDSPLPPQLRRRSLPRTARCELHRDPDERPQAAQRPVHRHLDERADQLGLGLRQQRRVDSTAKNPSHIYAAAGSYTVKLTATNAAGSDIETKTNYITVSNPPPPVANFTGTPTKRHSAARRSSSPTPRRTRRPAGRGTSTTTAPSTRPPRTPATSTPTQGRTPSS